MQFSPIFLLVVQPPAFCPQLPVYRRYLHRTRDQFQATIRYGSIFPLKLPAGNFNWAARPRGRLATRARKDRGLKLPADNSWTDRSDQLSVDQPSQFRADSIAVGSAEKSHQSLITEFRRPTVAAALFVCLCLFVAPALNEDVSTVSQSNRPRAGLVN